MISKEPTPLEKRRAELIAMCARQRQALTHDFETWKSTLAVADKGLHILQFVKQYPLLTAGVSALLAYIRPKGVWRWLHGSLGAVKVLRSLLK